MRRHAAFVAFACLLLVATIARAQAASQEWLAVSDIHFDPFADPRLAQRLADAPATRWRAILSSLGPQPFSNYGSDTNFPLLESTLDAMRNEVKEPPVVLVTGDLLAHGFREKFERSVRDHDQAHYEAFVDETVRFLAMEFRAAFPRARLIPVIGNNDNACADYQSTPGSPFLASMASAWGGSVGAPDPNAFAAQFATGGYYTVPLPAGNAQAVVLNDVFWSAAYTNACGQKASDPGGDELKWLSSTLTAIGSKNVWILAHVPPGIDAYASLRAGGTPVLMLNQRFNDAMINAILGGPVHVVAALAGHTHMNSYRILGPDPSRPNTPLIVLQSVSPIYANNPTFTELRVDDDGAQILDAQYFIIDDLSELAKNGRRPPRWRREFDFDSVYGRGTIDAPHLAQVQQAIFDDERVRKRFEEFYDGSSGRAAIPDANWHLYWCANVALTATQFQACASPQIQRQLPPHPSAPPSPSP